MAEGLDRSVYPAIPKKLWEYYERILVDRPSHRLVEATQRQGVDKTWRAINEIFVLACQATRLSSDELFELLGFKNNDLDSANFQSMLGVLRAINQLGQFGFTDVEPLPPKKSRREADFIAGRGGERYAIEVFRSSETAFRAVGHEVPCLDLAGYIEGRVNEKIKQVSSTIQTHNCDAGAIVVVLDSQPAKALSSAAELQQMVDEVMQRLVTLSKTYLIVFTGMADEYGRDEYVCCPALPLLG